MPYPVCKTEFTPHDWIIIGAGAALPDGASQRPWYLCCNCGQEAARPSRPAAGRRMTPQTEPDLRTGH